MSLCNKFQMGHANSRLRNPLKWGIFPLMSPLIQQLFRGRLIIIVLAPFLVGVSAVSQENLLPKPVTSEAFSHLTNHSPFLRSLDYSESFVLTGMARIEGNIYATLFDSESSESRIVSERMNPDGWQLVDVQGNESDLESLTANIQVNGGQVFAIRYQEAEFKPIRGAGGANRTGAGSGLNQEQIDSARRAGQDPAAGFRGDGYRGPPPPEILDKLRKISPAQREQLARRVMQMYNEGVDSEVRFKFYRESLDRAVQQR